MTLKRSIDYKDQLLTFKQLEGVVARKDIITGPADAIISQAKVNDFSWESAAQSYATFTKEEQADIRKSGQQLLAGYYDPATDTISAPGANPTEAEY